MNETTVSLGLTRASPPSAASARRPLAGRFPPAPSAGAGGRQPSVCCSPPRCSSSVLLSLCRSANCTESRVLRRSVLCHTPYVT
ncbi:unnamed protein product, partial [Iphiclides podalirius]